MTTSNANPCASVIATESNQLKEKSSESVQPSLAHHVKQLKRIATSATAGSVGEETNNIEALSRIAHSFFEYLSWANKKLDDKVVLVGDFDDTDKFIQQINVCGFWNSSLVHTYYHTLQIYA